jgi:hypothetical protein
MNLRAKLASAGALLGVAAAMVALAAPPALAAFCGGTQGQPLLIGCNDNIATSETDLSSTSGTVLFVQTPASGGVAIEGNGGVYGVRANGGMDGVYSSSPDGTGVFSEGAIYGVEGTTGTGTGVYGSSTGATGVGVEGTTTGNGSAVYGDNTGGTGSGVFGDATTGTGVLAHSSSGTALWVNGPAHFSQSGLATVPSGAKTLTVSMAGVTTSSMILATAQQGGGFYVKGAVPAAGSFTIAINKAPAAPQTVKVAFLVLN